MGLSFLIGTNMIYNTERVGRSAYYERPSRKGNKAEAEKAKAKAEICTNCTEKICNGSCKLFRRKK